MPILPITSIELEMLWALIKSKTDKTRLPRRHYSAECRLFGDGVDVEASPMVGERHFRQGPHCLTRLQVAIVWESAQMFHT